MKKEKLAVVIFRNNLRLRDNKALLSAQKENTNLLCLYPLEILEGFEYGFEKCGSFRKEFIKETLLSLHSDLDQHNISLYCVEDISQTLQKLHNQFDVEIYYAKEVGSQEESFEKKLQCYKHQSFFDQTMLEPFSFEYKKSFSHFRKKAEKLDVLKSCKKIDIQINNIRAFDIHNKKLTKNLRPKVCKGGETNALERVDFYLQNHIHTYYETRSLISAKDHSTMFSPYLSVGSLSPRILHEKLKQYEKELGASKSSYWIYFELLWREFFHQVMLQTPKELFLKKGLQGKSYPFITDQKQLNLFFDANTGVDIIDAGIKQLKTTGWISNRQRQLLASYFVKNLGLDFRYGAAFFEKYLIDYNPASNYGNWSYQAGVGHDKTYRVFDPVLQSKRYDGAKYVQKWLHKEEEHPKFDYKKMAQTVQKQIFQYSL